MQKLWKSCQTQLLSGEKGEGPQTLFAVSKNPERILGTVQSSRIAGVKRNVLLYKGKNSKALQMESMQHVSRSGEKGGMTTRSCRHWL